MERKKGWHPIYVSEAVLSKLDKEREAIKEELGIPKEENLSYNKTLAIILKRYRELRNAVKTQ